MEIQINGIWLKYGPHSSKNAVSAIDLLFGYETVDPRPNWNLIKTPIIGVSNPSDLPAYITFRRGPKIDYKERDWNNIDNELRRQI